jgi:hypothetical protein
MSTSKISCPQSLKAVVTEDYPQGGEIIGLTILSGQNLYADLPGLISRLANINDSKPHASGFYLKNGYTAIGVIPDANEPGKPDILMAKSIYNVA